MGVNIWRPNCGNENTFTEEEAMELKLFIPKVLQEYRNGYKMQSLSLELIGADGLMGQLIVKEMGEWQRDPAWQTIAMTIKVFAYAGITNDLPGFPDEVPVTVFVGDHHYEGQGEVVQEQNITCIRVPS